MVLILRWSYCEVLLYVCMYVCTYSSLCPYAYSMHIHIGTEHKPLQMCDNKNIQTDFRSLLKHQLVHMHTHTYYICISYIREYILHMYITQLRIYTYIRTYVLTVHTQHKYVCTYVCMYIRTYVHTYIRTWCGGEYINIMDNIQYIRTYVRTYVQSRRDTIKYPQYPHQGFFGERRRCKGAIPLPPPPL